jgi:4-amino-4-deoxychorismate lyase
MFWYDGKLRESNVIKLDIYNPAFLYGATVFTTIRVYQKSLDHPLTNWNYHLDRLNHSIQIFQWNSPYWQRIKKGTQQLLEHFPVLRITIFPDGKELIIGRDLPQDLFTNQQKGIIGWVANKSDQRNLSEHKTGNYLGPWLALQEAKKLGAEEAILIDKDRHWLETSTGNLWGYQGGIWFTPSLKEKILPGIMRTMIIEKANFPIQENVWNWNFVKTLEAIAYSNCVVELIPFNKIKISEQELNFDIAHPALNQLRIQPIKT